jgi:putative transposase
VACRVLNISRSGFYDWLGRPEPPRELRNRELMKIIREIHAGSRGSYGSPRVHAELRLGKGMQVTASGSSGWCAKRACGASTGARAAVTW